MKLSQHGQQWMTPLQLMAGWVYRQVTVAQQESPVIWPQSGPGWASAVAVVAASP